MFSDSSRFADGVILVLLVLLLLITATFFLRQGFGTDEAHFQLSQEGGAVRERPQEEVKEKRELVVHISGAVQRPGVYYLEEGDRVLHVIQRGGGPSLDGDLHRLNLAAPLYDGQKIVVPVKGQEEQTVELLEGGGGGTTHRININTSSLKELETLPGVGPSRAQAILDYRQQEGPFSTREELMNVSGIGEKTFETLQELITLY